MSDDTDRPGEQDRQTVDSFGLSPTATVPLLPVVYVLSFGRACWLGNNGYLGDWAKVLYIPLALLAGFCPPIRHAACNGTLTYGDNRSPIGHRQQGAIR